MTSASRVLVEQLLDAVEAEATGSDLFEGSLSRAQAREVLRATTRLYGCRQGSTAAVYAHQALFQALGIAWPQTDGAASVGRASRFAAWLLRKRV